MAIWVPLKRAKKKAQASKRRVNMLDGTLGDDSGTEADEWEDSDEDLMGANYGQGLRALRPARAPTRQGLNLTQAYSNCQCGDDDLPVTTQDDLVQDKEEIISTLGGWAHKTFIETKRKKNKAAPKTYSIQTSQDLDKMLDEKSKVAQIAAKSNQSNFSGADHLPNIPLEDDEMVMLVDSGSTLNAADIAKHFSAYVDLIVASRGQAMGESATTAGGHKLANEGRCRVNATVNGEDFPVPFQNMKVDVPILSGRKYMKNGYDFHFTEQGGYMKCRLNGKIFNFIEADGAFWIKMRISAPPSGKAKSSVFSRPGTA